MPLIYIQDEFGCPAPVDVSVLGLGTDDQTAAEVPYTPGTVTGAATVQEAIDQLAQCQVCAVQATNDCSGGVGAAYAVRQAALANGVLTLDGAPEHTSMANHQWTPIALAPGLEAVFGGPVFDGVRTSVILFDLEEPIVNPSPCRAMAVLITVTATGYTGITPGTNINYYLQLYLDGVAQNHAILQSDVDNAGVEGSFSFTLTAAVAIPPAGSVLLRSIAWYELYWGQVTAVSVGNSRTWFGSTV